MNSAGANGGYANRFALRWKAGGQPREWLYYCEDVEATFFSVPALIEDFAIGFVSVIVLWQLAKFVFGKSPEPKPQE